MRKNLIVVFAIITIFAACSKKHDPTAPVFPSATPTPTNSAVAPSPTMTFTMTKTAALTATYTRTQIPAATATYTRTQPPSTTATVTAIPPTLTMTPTASVTPPPGNTATITPVGTLTVTRTAIPSRTFTPTAISSPADTPTVTFTAGAFQTPTITPTTGSSDLWVESAQAVQGFIDYGYFSTPLTQYAVSLKQGSAIGPILTGASVDVNGQVVTDQGDGTYVYQNLGLILNAPGTVLNLTINSASGNGTSSITVPPSVSIISPAANSTVSNSAGFSITWSYSGGTPTGVTLVVEDAGYTSVITQYLPGTVTNYTISAGMCVTGTTTVGLMISDEYPISGALPGSANFMYGYVAMNAINITP